MGLRVIMFNNKIHLEPIQKRNGGQTVFPLLLGPLLRGCTVVIIAFVCTSVSQFLGLSMSQ